VKSWFTAGLQRHHYAVAMVLGGTFRPDSAGIPNTELGFLYFEKPERVPCLTGRHTSLCTWYVKYVPFLTGT